MAKMSQKAKEYYQVIHNMDVRKVLYQIEVSAREDRPDELCDLDQKDYDKLVELLAKYFAMLQRIN